MQPTKPSSAGQQQQQSHSQGPGRPQPKSGADKQTRSEIENRPTPPPPPPPAAREEAEREVAGGTNLGATRAEVAREGADLPLVAAAATSRAVPFAVERTACEGAHGEPSCVVIEFCVQPDDKQSESKRAEQNLEQIQSSRASGELLAKVEREPNNAQERESGERKTNDDDDDDDPVGQIRFEQQQQQKRRQAPSDFRDPRLDQQRGRSGARISAVAAAAAEVESSSDSWATGTGAVICGLVDGSEQTTAAGRPPTWRKSDRPTGASDELPAEVGCQKLQQQSPRLFDQNTGPILSELEVHIGHTNQNQANQKQQRIKVTLSKPKQELEQEEEARKLGEFYTQTTTLTGDQCSASSSHINFGQVRAPRRSTATLISGSSEPEVDSFESIHGTGAEAHPPEKINQIWRDREQPATPQSPAQDTSKQVGVRAGGKDSAGQHELELTRLERENQLRRIASQRRRAPPPPALPLSASAAGQSAAAASTSANEGPTRRSVRAARAGAAASDEKEKRNFLLATATSRAGQQQTSSNSKQLGGGCDLGPTQANESQTRAKIVIPQASVEQHQIHAPIKQSQTQCAIESGQQQQQQDPSLPSKQLAIYINGKIRSNSIFCSRSVSSNSFTSILKSFQHYAPSSSGDQQQQPASDLEQRLACNTPNNDRQAFLTGSHSKSQAAAAAASAKEFGEDHNTEGQPANKSFVHCLVPKRSQHSPAGPLETFVGVDHQHERHIENNKRSFLARCRDYILGPSGGGDNDASKSAGCCDTQESQVKRPVEATATTNIIATDQATNADQQPRTYKLNPSSMFLRKAMRYYRLWIYSANLTILLGAIIFLLSTLYVVSDYRFQLIVASSTWPPTRPAPPFDNIQAASTIMGHQKSSLSDNDNRSTTRVVVGGAISGDNLTQQVGLSTSASDPVQSFTISLSEPTIILAYLMIVFQLGLLQALGCFGAIQMKERLIQAFWYLILALIVMDALILVYWLQRYDSMLRSLRDEMTNRLERQYGQFEESNGSLLDILNRDGVSHDLASRNTTANFDDFTRNNSERQNSAHVAGGDAQQTGLQEARLQFDKIFTQIFDRVQSESRCCGMSSSLDYKHTRWREARVAQLREQYLKQEQQDPENHVSQDQVIFQLDKLLAQLPLVPSSCCRPNSKNNDEGLAHKQANNVIEQYLDDSQLPQRARVPAWSPSMVVDNLIVGYGGDNFGSGQKLNAVSQQQQQQRLVEDGTWTNKRRDEGDQDEPTLADVIDRRWSSGSRPWRHSKPATAADDDDDQGTSGGHQYESDWTTPDDDHDKFRSHDKADDGDGNKKTTRLLAKQMHYGHDVLRGTSSVAAGDEREAGEDLERPEGVARQLRRWAASRGNDDDLDDRSAEDEDEGEEEEDGPDASSTSTRNELQEETKDNNNNESGHDRRQYRAENDELLSSDSRKSALAATGGLVSGGQASQHISNSQEDDESDQWAIETELDKRGRVLARLVELATKRHQHRVNGTTTTTTTTTIGPDGMRESAAAQSRPNGGDAARLLAAELDKLTPKINNELRLGLTRDQFQLIESYLTSDEIGQMTDEQLHGRRNQQQEHEQQKTFASSQAGKVISRRSILSAPSAGDQDKQPALDAEKLAARQRARVKQLKRLQELVARGPTGGGDRPTACLPRSHYDEARIYTRGCQAHIRAWLQSSANILFVMGFCVLTVLKFCSLILLRLELREMIHKIKVLKGMATEYNALQDLEPYLPRPSICAQAAELTSTGVTSALGVSAGGGSPTAQMATGLSNSANAIGQMQQQQQAGVASEPGGGPLAASCSSPTATASGYMGVPRRIGGSFSEAVAAATAVAHQQKLAEQQQQQQAQLARHLRHCERASSLANCARAASTKTILGGGCSCAASLGPAGVAGMLTAPHHYQSGLCPCASSLSMTAHLSHSASQSQATPATGLSLRSDLFPPLGVAMPRRHTAVSVCPAAAAAATAAAHHLMMRRGTFALANPLTFTSTGQQQQQQAHYQQQQPPPSHQPGILKPTGGSSAVLSAAVSSANMLQAKSLNYLNQHRHSAHAVPPSHLLFGGGGGGGDGGARGMNLLNPTNRHDQRQQARRASNLSPSEMIAAATANDNTNHQHLGENSNQQQPVFRRQASGGAQSAVNFSLDIAPGAAAAGEQLGESRRSIH